MPSATAIHSHIASHLRTQYNVHATERPGVFALSGERVLEVSITKTHRGEIATVVLELMEPYGPEFDRGFIHAGRKVVNGELTGLSKRQVFAALRAMMV
jgi:hypothetical protein